MLDVLVILHVEFNVIPIFPATYEGAVQDFHHSKLKRKVTLKRSICSATLVSQTRKLNFSNAVLKWVQSHR